MNNLINEIKELLREQEVGKITTSAGDSIDNATKAIEDEVKEDGLEGKKRKKSGKESAKAKEAEDADIVKSSKADLEKSEKEDDQSQKEDRPSEKVETPDESPSTINLADAMSFEGLIDILNQFRAAHSFTDKEVYNRLKDYFEKLEDAEKKVLHIFIKGLIQTTMLNVDGKSAYAPSDLMFNITKTGSASSEKRRSQARKIDAQEKAKKQDSTSIITVGPSS